MSQITDRSLNDCGCCAGLSNQTPVQLNNRPGLAAIAYRVGNHAQFKQTMLAHLWGQAALRELNTRADDDFAIALLDAWATVADVLTFYQERIANESYLRTATERRSVLELARAIGYDLRPGVAASTYLAFKLDPTPGAPRRTTIDAGIKVQSVPDPGEQAQIFETIEKIEARAAWNDIKPRLTERQPLTTTTNRLFFEGIATNLKAGDGVLFKADDGAAVFGSVVEVKPYPEQGRTEVVLQLFPSPPIQGSVPNLEDTGGSTLALGPLATKYTGTKLAADLQAEAETNRFQVQELFDNLAANPLPPPQALVFRTRTAIFGHNAPAWESLPATLRGDEPVYEIKNGQVSVKTLTSGPYTDRKDSWADMSLLAYLTYLDSLYSIFFVFGNVSTSIDIGTGAKISSSARTDVHLDNVYSSLAKDSVVVMKDGNKCGIYKINEVTELSMSDFTISAKVTRLTLDSQAKFNQFGIRTTVIYAQSEKLTLASLPVMEPVPSNPSQPNQPFKLNGWVDGLFAGQQIMIVGELATARGTCECEYTTLDQVEHIMARDGCTQITLKPALQNQYVRATVTINANVAQATHGETKQEILGSGDGSRPYQRFTLRQPPLTHITASTASGTASTLKVYVNDVLWQETPTLYGHGPNERIYITRIDDEGKTTVQFGDGRTGVRLPGGPENVRAVYRQGLGLAGLIKPGQLTLLMTRPPGVQSVTNLLPATGGDDREALQDARRNAPLTIMTLDRIVSLQDYEDFARAFAGIAKALATWTRSGEKRGVLVTVAGPKGVAILPSGKVYQSLLTAMKQAGDPYIPVRVETYTPKFFRISAKVKIDPSYLPERVLPAVETTLRAAFSFQARAFGQPVTLGEVMAVMQGVPGVEAVDIDMLLIKKNGTFEEHSGLVLPAASPQAGADANAQPAELLTLDSAPLNLGVMP